MSGAAARRLRALAGEHDLDGEVVERLEVLLRVVAQDDTAPTTVRDPARGVDVHVADSLSGLALPEVRAARRIADLGSGAGFPGLVLAAALPAAEVAVVDSVARKGAFLERAIAAMGLANAAVVVARAEEWGAGRERHDLVTARALSELPVIVEYAAPLLAAGGALVAWKGARNATEEADGAAAARETGLEPGGIVAVTPFAGVEHRNLHRFAKTGSTANRFPRRAGMARKRPIRAPRQA